MLSFEAILLFLSALLSLCSMSCAFSVTFPQHIFKDEVSSALDMTLTFDDISPDGLSSISRYAHLDFFSFSCFNATQAAQNRLIASGDANCAASQPNALFAWRKNSPRVWPRFVLNAEHAAEEDISPYFDLSGLAVKRMNNTPLYTAVFLQAWGIDFSNSSNPVVKKHYLLVSSNLRAGTQPQHPIDITNLFPGWGRNVNMVEMWAVTQNGEDWPLCVDDIRVQFHKPNEHEHEEALETPWSWTDVEEWQGRLGLQAQRFL